MNLEEVKKECIEFINKRFDALATETPTEKPKDGEYWHTDGGNMVRVSGSPREQWGYYLVYPVFSSTSTWFSGAYPIRSFRRKCTPSEVEAALIKEAEKRGFKEGVIIKGGFPGNLEKNFALTVKGGFEYWRDKLLVISGYKEEGCGAVIYKNGKWAEIIKEEPIEIDGYGVEFHERGISFGYITIPNGVLEKIYNKQFKK